jgi:hypothetical protein
MYKAQYRLKQKRNAEEEEEEEDKRSAKKIRLFLI